MKRISTIGRRGAVSAAAPSDNGHGEACAANGVHPNPTGNDRNTHFRAAAGFMLHAIGAFLPTGVTHRPRFARFGLGGACRGTPSIRPCRLDGGIRAANTPSMCPPNLESAPSGLHPLLTTRSAAVPFLRAANSFLVSHYPSLIDNSSHGIEETTLTHPLHNTLGSIDLPFLCTTLTIAMQGEVGHV